MPRALAPATPESYNAGTTGNVSRTVVMASFDIVSKLDLAEVDNALAGLAREISTRFDFKGSKSTVTRDQNGLTILADDELKLRQVQELLRMHMVRRKV